MHGPAPSPLRVWLTVPSAPCRVAVAAPQPELGRREGDPVVAIACTLFETAASSGSAPGAPAGGPSASPITAATAMGEGIKDSEGSEDGGEEGNEEGPEAASVEAAPPQSSTVVDAIRPGRAAHAACAPDGQAFVFLLAPAVVAAGRREALERSLAPGGAAGAAQLLFFDSEEELLLCWAETVRAADPDVLACFQVGGLQRQLACPWSVPRLEPRSMPQQGLACGSCVLGGTPVLESPPRLAGMPTASALIPYSTCAHAAVQVKDTLAVLQERFAALCLQPLKASL